MASPPQPSPRGVHASLVTSVSFESLASDDELLQHPSSPPSHLSDAALCSLWESRPLMAQAMGEWLDTTIGRPRRRWRRSSSDSPGDASEDAISDVSDAEEEEAAPGSGAACTSPRATSVAAKAAATVEAEEANRDSAFDCIEPPTMPPADYAARLARYSYASPPCLVLATIYMDRAAERSPLLALSPLNVHRLLLASVGVAAKVHDDAAASARHYALVGGVEVEEVSALEMELLGALNWRTYVSETEYASQLRRLVGGASPAVVAAAVGEVIPADAAARKACVANTKRPMHPASAERRRQVNATADAAAVAA